MTPLQGFVSRPLQVMKPIFLLLLKLVSPALMRAKLRSWVARSPLLHFNEDFGLELSGDLQFLDSSHPQGVNKGSEPRVCVFV